MSKANETAVKNFVEELKMQPMSAYVSPDAELVEAWKLPVLRADSIPEAKMFLQMLGFLPYEGGQSRKPYDRRFMREPNKAMELLGKSLENYHE